MIFTLYYAYATLMQWWRLRSLRSKLNGTLNDQNALLVCSGQIINYSRKHRSLENLLFRTENRIACTVVPKQKLNLSQWIAFPKNLRHFPIYIKNNKPPISEENGTVYILLQAILETYTRHQSDIVQIENFGELLGWKAVDCFEVIIRSNLNQLTKLVNQFAQNDVDINHELRLLKIETVDIEGTATSVKYEKKYLKEQTLKYSYAPIHWNKFVAEVKDLYSKVRDTTNPKIKIENGSTKCFDTSQKQTKKDQKLKPNEDKHTLDVIKKELKKAAEDKNTLDVSSTTDHRRHKCGEHNKAQNKPERRTSRTKLDGTSKPKHSKTKGDEEKNEVPPKLKRERRRSSGNKLIKQNSVVENDTEHKLSSKEDSLPIPENSIDIPQQRIKPPNVLVYADSVVTKDNVKRVLYSILNKEKYTIYDLPTLSKQTFWDKSTVLVVVCGSVPPDLTSNLIQYLLNGGQLLCLCSDLMYSVLHTFTTAEVREHELVRFSYGSWERVKMMHHIFCYQASPAKKQFSKDSDQSNHSSNGSSPLAPRTPTNVELKHNDKDYNIQVQVLGTEETWHTPSLLLAKVKNAEGRAVFSQVHLEIDPEEYENDEDKYQSLRSSNEARLEILKDILCTHLDLVCDDNYGNVEYSPGYFLGRYDSKMDMVSNCENITGNQLTCDKINVIFCGHNADPGPSTNIRLPVLIHSCPQNFSTLDYFETLDTEDIGRLVIYSDIVTSSQHILSKKLRHGLVVIPKQQTNGVGRSANSWLSPLGSASFSLQMHIPLNTPLGNYLPLIQHLVMVAVISAVKKLPGYEYLKIGIKWPNDLYANSNVKIGGLIINSTIVSDIAIVNVGCGVNLSNKNPTTCINDLVEVYNQENNCCLKSISYEKYFAIVFNELERLYKEIQSINTDCLFDLYYQYWLHNDADITIQSEKGDLKQAKIIGLDNYGFLRVRLSDGSLTSVQPDGNSFDMMKGLIAPKYF